MTDIATRRPAIPCKICRDGSGRHPVYSSMDDRRYGVPEGYLCNDCADSAPTSMVEITPEGEEVPRFVPPRTVNVTIRVDVRSFAEAVRSLGDQITRGIQKFSMWLSTLGDPQPSRRPTPTHAADRTNSPRRAAGSRRTKRHARRRG